jgi:hypothetical protein
MSRFARYLLCTAVAVSACAGTAGAQLLGAVVLPPIGLPGAARGLPVAGPALQNILGSPQLQQQVLAPTLDSVAGLPEDIAQSGASTLADLRKMRLERLIRDNRAVLEGDEHGAPVRRGILIAADPDPMSLQMAQRAGFTVQMSNHRWDYVW